MNIKQIKEKLKMDDWCEEMREIGYDMISFDDDNAGWAIFADVDNEKLIYVNKDEEEFTIFINAGKYSLDKLNEKVKP